jgi:hypothetical protein
MFRYIKRKIKRVFIFIQARKAERRKRAKWGKRMMLEKNEGRREK